MSGEEQTNNERLWSSVIKAGNSLISGTTMPFDYARHLTKAYDTYTLLRPHLTGSAQKALDDQLEEVVQSMSQLQRAFQSTKDVFNIDFFESLNSSLEERITEYQNEYATRGWSS